MIGRRPLFAAAAATLVAPSIRAQAAKVLRFVPRNDLDITDPVWTSTYVTRNHGYLVYDTLYGLDEHLRPHPQMVEGHVVEEGGKLWNLTLREGLRFHDGEPVLARDCVASIRRWGARDPLGSTLMDVTAELSAPSDRVIRFRLRKPFPMLPEALGKAASHMPCIMPERLAQTSPNTPVREVIGSGPFMFAAEERVPGARNIYKRFADYRPRPGGTPSFTAGPKIVKVDRVEWTTMPDAGTAASALLSGEVDWFERPSGDLLDLMRRNRDVVIEVSDPTGQISIMRLNHLHPPFDNAAIRRIVLNSVVQSDFMRTMMGDDTSLWRDGIGFFAPGPMASDAGMDSITGARDIDRSRRDLLAAGYANEPVVVIQNAASAASGVAEVGVDLLKRIGFNVQPMLMDNAAMNQRRVKREPPTQGGWSAFFTSFGGLDQMSPAGHLVLRGHGDQAFAGWPRSPRIEALRDAWFDAPDEATQKALCADMQRQAMLDVPYIPLGQSLDPTAYRRNVTGIPRGFCLFWNLDKT
ncbi:ABC transporter substrate-binding protein [Pseudoroseomonas oryzae]|uniref:ABC transporter substrate-binding protein n=1 Tax=Teichococcus oryzae TaxID=1608942 RepID=A0A5B2TCF5_9PROT|nr:ABC transporter substrate-binding protein [Pseudoroseomonas oryzae]KAA2212181.1 ABC transporter substrate-binding protein [Pseudoroseomonas oryzae]